MGRVHGLFQAECDPRGFQTGVLYFSACANYNDLARAFGVSGCFFQAGERCVVLLKKCCSIKWVGAASSIPYTSAHLFELFILFSV
ncbi:Hypothetical protein HDN1F_33470 [gamma proteobacterium HdN1]|nr:Hypothetical protein HDN1F_33470 [gamma proteobacterium HdN1]